MTISKKAKTQWNKSAISYRNFLKYIDSKTYKFELTLVDLLYISNFKGGNSTINEDELEIKGKLKSYSKALEELETMFHSRTLVDIDDKELIQLIEKVKLLCSLTRKGAACNIDGFSVSYLSALLNCYFPNLLPILDRRVLINLGIVADQDINTQGQIINIENFYEPLIAKMREKSRLEDKTLRQIDMELFIIEIPKEKQEIENEN